MGNRDDARTDFVGEQLANCGPRLHQLREGRGWTLDELSERSALSKAYLSRLEAGDRHPSIAALLTLARVYDVAVGALFEAAEPSANYVVVRGGQARLRQGNGLTYASLSSAARFANLQPIRITISADRRGDERYQHEGEEWVYVLKGRVRLAIGDRSEELGVGDAAHFDSRLPHRLTALGGKDAELIVVACPLPEAGTVERERRFHRKRAVT